MAHIAEPGGQNNGARPAK